MKGGRQSVQYATPLATACSNILFSALNNFTICCVDGQAVHAAKADKENVCCAPQEAADVDRCAICHRLQVPKYVHASCGARTLAMRPSYSVSSAVSGLGQ